MRIEMEGGGEGLRGGGDRKNPQRREKEESANYLGLEKWVGKANDV
jgi:hypothetical protein